MTQKYYITLLPGDGIGPEIMAVAVDVLKSVSQTFDISFEFSTALIGGAAIDETGEPLPAVTLDKCRHSDSVLLAAIGGYKWDSLSANLRPAKILPQLIDASSLKREIVEGVDIMVVRELTGGIYFGKPKGIFATETGEKRGVNTMVYSESEIERIGRVAFETARKRGGKLCSVDKANVLEVSQLWRDRMIQLSAEYTDVELSHLYVDNAAMQLVRAPKQFDTIVTGNLFGDILSDAAAMLTGSIGMLPSASLGADGPGVYEPVHGSAPDIAGLDKANPLAQVLSTAMMLRYALNQPEAADLIENSVLEVLEQGYRTGDIMSPGMKLVGCRAMGAALIQILELKSR